MSFARWKDGYLRWRARERAWRELNGLSDRQLDDIGLNRSDIPAVVMGRVTAKV